MSDVAERRRVRIVGLGAVGYAVIIVSTMVQTYAGRAPLSLTTASMTFAVLGLALLATATALALRGLAVRPKLL
jgi:hypothetical protein